MSLFAFFGAVIGWHHTPYFCHYFPDRFWYTVPSNSSYSRNGYKKHNKYVCGLKLLRNVHSTYYNVTVKFVLTVVYRVKKLARNEQIVKTGHPTEFYRQSGYIVNYLKVLFILFPLTIFIQESVISAVIWGGIT
jgi:hypothetical protein